jgi:predicted peptidase
MYNIFVPEHHEKGKKYPLVVFIPDASVNGNDPRMALAQGIGATVWAEDEWQKDHPCYVLAFQIPKNVHLTTDEYTCAPEINEIKELIDRVINDYDVDPNRVYTTGQSQGCMASCCLNIAYPDLFAASVLVAAHWDVEKMLAQKDAKFFFGYSTGALRENVCFGALAEGYPAEGVETAVEHFNFRDGWDVNNEKCRKLVDTDATKIFAMFDGETAFPDDGIERPIMSHHNRGWELTYQLKPMREWLFNQHK